MVLYKKTKKAEKKPAGRKTLKKMAKSYSEVKRQAPKPVLPAKSVPLPPKLLIEPASQVEEAIRREGTGFNVAVDHVEGETIIGDLIVVFPWRRETFFS